MFELPPPSVYSDVFVFGATFCLGRLERSRPRLLMMCLLEGCKRRAFLPPPVFCCWLLDYILPLEQKNSGTSSLKFQHYFQKAFLFLETKNRNLSPKTQAVSICDLVVFQLYLRLSDGEFCFPWVLHVHPPSCLRLCQTVIQRTTGRSGGECVPNLPSKPGHI